MPVARSRQSGPQCSSAQLWLSHAMPRTRTGCPAGHPTIHVDELSAVTKLLQVRVTENVSVPDDADTGQLAHPVFVKFRSLYSNFTGRHIGLWRKHGGTELSLVEDAEINRANYRRSFYHHSMGASVTRVFNQRLESNPICRSRQSYCGLTTYNGNDISRSAAEPRRKARRQAGPAADAPSFGAEATRLRPAASSCTACVLRPARLPEPPRSNSSSPPTPRRTRPRTTAATGSAIEHTTLSPLREHLRGAGPLLSERRLAAD